MRAFGCKSYTPWLRSFIKSKGLNPNYAGFPSQNSFKERSLISSLVKGLRILLAERLSLVRHVVS